VLALWTPTGARLTVAALAYVAFVVQQRARLPLLTNGGWLTAALFPVTTLIFVAIFVRSLWWTFIRRRVRWRGRDIALKPAVAAAFDTRPEA
jgi:4,4'-diaponeurosporenoate glycosyltransferase